MRAHVQEQPGCDVLPDGRVRGVSSDICERLVRSWSTYFGLRLAEGSLRVVDTTGYHSTVHDSVWRMLAPRQRGQYLEGAVRTRDGIPHYYANDIIPHEIGHSALSAGFTGLIPPRHGDGYGTSLPDWLDEAAAIAMESRPTRERRMREIRTVHPSLERLATMEHPKGLSDSSYVPPGLARRWERMVVPPCTRCTWLPDSLRRKYQITDVGINEAGRRDTLVWYADRDPNNLHFLEARLYFPLAYSLFRFIHHRGGPVAVRETVTRYARNPSAGLPALAGLPGLPRTIAEFETAWLAFIRNPPPEPD